MDCKSVKTHESVTDFYLLTHFLPVYHILYVCVCVCASASRRGSSWLPLWREYREAASWRQELGPIWQTLGYTVYDWKQIKSAENKRRLLCAFIQKLISVRSGRGFTASLSLLRANYTTCDYSSLSIRLGPTALHLRFKVLVAIFSWGRG